MTELDLQGLDIIGWNLRSSAVTPEPSTFAAFAVGMVFFACRQRRRRQQSSQE